MCGVQSRCQHAINSCLEFQQAGTQKAALLMPWKLFIPGPSQPDAFREIQAHCNTWFAPHMSA